DSLIRDIEVAIPARSWPTGARFAGGGSVDQGSLDRIEFQQVVAAIAAHARSEAGRMRLLAWRPFTERGERDREIERLREATLRVPPGLGERLAMAFDADGHVVDGASPALKRLRAEGAEGARRLEQQLERWAREFGADAYVTRHGERFVAMVPADGFPRRRG